MGVADHAEDRRAVAPDGVGVVEAAHGDEEAGVVEEVGALEPAVADVAVDGEGFGEGGLGFRRAAGALAQGGVVSEGDPQRTAVVDGLVKLVTS